MEVKFSKYQGTGNDFIMLNNMDGRFESLSLDQIIYLCDRKIGIGADGLIKISNKEGLDFEMEYFNADGSQSFCGNGARCSVAFAKELGLLNFETRFLAIDGAHTAIVKGDIVELEMLPVQQIDRDGIDYVIDTGSPHYIHSESADAIECLNIVDYGRKVRFSPKYVENGINVNVMARLGENKIRVVTYERGVEDETLSCGTGVTACALALMSESVSDELVPVEVQTKGGHLHVSAERDGKGFTNVWLSGPAKMVFNGVISV